MDAVSAVLKPVLAELPPVERPRRIIRYVSDGRRSYPIFSRDPDWYIDQERGRFPDEPPEGYSLDINNSEDSI